MKGYTESWKDVKKRLLEDWRFRLWWILLCPEYLIERWKILREIKKREGKEVMNPTIWRRIENRRCVNCGEPLVPDRESKNFITGKWDGHTYKSNCDCLSKGLKVSIG